jgi:hypothetical protein
MLKKTLAIVTSFLFLLISSTNAGMVRKVVSFTIKATDLDLTTFESKPHVFVKHQRNDKGDRTRRIRVKISERPGAFPVDTINCSAKVPENIIWSTYILTADKKPGEETLCFSAYSDGRKYKAGEYIFLLSLKGNFYQMGVQYGALMKDELDSYYTEIVREYLIDNQKKTYDWLVNDANEDYDDLPEYMRQIIQGMAKGWDPDADPDAVPDPDEDPFLGYKLDKQKIISSSGGNVAPDPGCSGIATWGNYTSDQKLVFGRNWDWTPTPGLKTQMKYFCVTTFNPEGSGNSVANIHPLGDLSIENGFNNKGIFLELNSGKGSEDNDKDDRLDSTTLLFTFLLESENLDNLDKHFKSTLNDSSYIINCANSDVAYSYEWPTFDVSRRSGDTDGLLVATNYFVDPPAAWTGKIILPVDQDRDYFKRRQNLLTLANSAEYKGKLNVEKMKELLAVQYGQHGEGGGATFGEEWDFGTAYQIIAVPADKKIWITMGGIQDWTEIDLTKLFNP